VGYPQFSYFHSRAPAALKTVDFDSVKLGWTMFERQQAVDRALAISMGRRPVSVVHSAYATMEIEFGPFERENEAEFFEQAWAWSSHAMAGGIFAVTFDSALQASALTTVETTHNATSISVPSTTFLAGQQVIFIDPDDDWLTAVATILSIPDPTHVNLARQIGFVFRVGSVMRHVEYFPQCVLMETKAPFKEQKASDGPGWAFKGTLETVVSP